MGGLLLLLPPPVIMAAFVGCTSAPAPVSKSLGNPNKKEKEDSFILVYQKMGGLLLLLPVLNLGFAPAPVPAISGSLVNPKN